MFEDPIELFVISLNIITLVLLLYLLLSKHKHKITLVGFWQNIVLLISMLTISKMLKFFGYNYFSEIVFVLFSFLVMLIMVVSFTFHYPAEEGFEFKEKAK
ncbi:MAG: hypothetical protein AABW85_03410 [archaeon]